MSWPAMVAAHATVPEAGGRDGAWPLISTCTAVRKGAAKEAGSRERRVDHDRLRPWYTAVTRRGRPSSPGWPLRCQRLPNLRSRTFKCNCRALRRYQPFKCGSVHPAPTNGGYHQTGAPEGTPAPWVRAVTSPPAPGRRAGRLRTWRRLGLGSGACPVPVLGAAQADRSTGWCGETSLRWSFIAAGRGSRDAVRPAGTIAAEARRPWRTRSRAWPEPDQPFHPVHPVR
jgi:hypothetical protein